MADPYAAYADDVAPAPAPAPAVPPPQPAVDPYASYADPTPTPTGDSVVGTYHRDRLAQLGPGADYGFYNSLSQNADAEKARADAYDLTIKPQPKLSPADQAINSAAPVLRAPTDQGMLTGIGQGLLNAGGGMARGAASLMASPLGRLPTNPIDLAQALITGRLQPAMVSQEQAQDLSDYVAAQKEERQDANEAHQEAQGNAETVGNFAPLVAGAPGLAVLAGTAGGNRRQDVLESGGSETKANLAGLGEGALMYAAPWAGKAVAPLAGALGGTVGTTADAIMARLEPSTARAISDRLASSAATGTENAAMGAAFPAADAAISAATGDPERAKAELASMGSTGAGFGLLGAALGLGKAHAGRIAPEPAPVAETAGVPHYTPLGDHTQAESNRLDDLWAPFASAPPDKAIQPAPGGALGAPDVAELRRPAPEFQRPTPEQVAADSTPEADRLAFEKAKTDPLDDFDPEQIGRLARADGGQQTALDLGTRDRMAAQYPTEELPPPEAAHAEPAPAPERAEGRPEGEATPEAQAAADSAGVTVDRTRDVPLGGGISEDGKTVYIDRGMPRTVDLPDGRKADVDASLIQHETAEHGAMRLGDDYFTAHEDTANPAENAHLQAQGVKPEEFNAALQPHLDAAADRARAAVQSGTAQNLPPDLHPKHVAASAAEGLIDDGRPRGAADGQAAPQPGSAAGNVPRPMVAKVPDDHAAQGLPVGQARAVPEALPRGAAAPVPADRSPPAPSSGVAPGERKNLRPDLATPGLDPRQRDAYVASRNEAVTSERGTNEDRRAAANQRIRANPEGELETVKERLRSGARTGDDNFAAHTLLDKLYGTKDYQELNLLYQRGASNAGDTLQSLRDRVSTPAGRLGEARSLANLPKPEDAREQDRLQKEIDQIRAEKADLEAQHSALQRQMAAGPRTSPPTLRSKLAARKAVASVEFKALRDQLNKSFAKLNTGVGAQGEIIAKMVGTLIKHGVGTFGDVLSTMLHEVRALRHDPDAHAAIEAAYDEAQGKDAKAEKRTQSAAAVIIADPKADLQARIEARTKRLQGLEDYKRKYASDLAAMTPEQRQTFLDGEAAGKSFPPEVQAIIDAKNKELRALDKQIGALSKEGTPEEEMAKAEKAAKVKVARTDEQKEAQRLASLEKGLADRAKKLAGMTPVERAQELAKERAEKRTPPEVQKLRDASAQRLSDLRKQISTLERETEVKSGYGLKKTLQEKRAVMQRSLAETKDRWKARADRLASMSLEDRQREAINRQAPPEIAQEQAQAREELKPLRQHLESLNRPPETLGPVLSAKMKALDARYAKKLAEYQDSQKKSAKRAEADKVYLKKLGYDLDRPEAWLHSPGGFENFLAALASTKGGVSDIVREHYVGLLHMSGTILGKKIMADGLAVPTMIVDNVGEGLLNLVPGLRTKDGASITSTGKMLLATIPAAGKAIRNGFSTLISERTPEFLKSADSPEHYPALRRVWGRIFRFGTELSWVKALDVATRTMVSHMEVAAQAYRSAIGDDGKRLTGDALAKHIAWETQDYTSKSWGKARQEAMERSFTDKNGPLTMAINRLKYMDTTGSFTKKGIKLAANAAFPIIGIPAKILRYDWKRWTPILSDLIAMRDALRRNPETGNWEYDRNKFKKQTVQAALRWSAVAGLAAMYQNGDITGTDNKEHPSSVLLFGKWVNVKEVPGLAWALPTVADWMHGGASQVKDGTLHRLGETVYARPLADIYYAMQAKDGLVKYLAGKVPTPSIMRQGYASGQDFLQSRSGVAEGDALDRFISYVKENATATYPAKTSEGIPIERDSIEGHPTLTKLFRMLSPMQMGTKETPEGAWQAAYKGSQAPVEQLNKLKHAAKVGGRQEDDRAADRYEDDNQDAIDHARDLRDVQKRIMQLQDDMKEQGADVKGITGDIRTEALRGMRLIEREKARRAISAR